MSLQARNTRENQVQPGGTAPTKLKFKRDASGKLVADEPKPELKTAVEAAERPVTPDDPRTGPMRDVPPVGPV